MSLWLRCNHHHIYVFSWPSGKLPFDCQKIAKNLTLFQKKLPKLFIFFKKIANGNFFEKNENFWQFFSGQVMRDS